MPGKRKVFTTRVEPVSSPSVHARKGRIFMVETPGTAPGSTTLIPRSVYRHSQGASPSCTAEHKEHTGFLQEARCGWCDASGVAGSGGGLGPCLQVAVWPLRHDGGAGYCAAAAGRGGGACRWCAWLSARTSRRSRSSTSISNASSVLVRAARISSRCTPVFWGGAGRA